MSDQVKRERGEEDAGHTTPRSRRRKLARNTKPKAVESDVDRVKAEDVALKKEIMWGRGRCILSKEEDDVKKEEDSIKVEENTVKVEANKDVPDVQIKVEGGGAAAEAGGVKTEEGCDWEEAEREVRYAIAASEFSELLRRRFGGRGGWKRITRAQRDCE